MKTKLDYDSIINQEIKSKFVRQHVLTCFSYEMDAVLKAHDHGNFEARADLPGYEDIENGYEKICPNCGSDDIYKVPQQDKPSANDDCFECGSCGVLKENESLDSQPKEIYEWWIVSNFLCKELRKQDEAVIEWGNNCYWGRTCTGQAIMLDHVISVICEEMEILDGQKYSWAEKKG